MVGKRQKGTLKREKGDEENIAGRGFMPEGREIARGNTERAIKCQPYIIGELP
jgi:hypothetical protein